jgi:hypothetical protein
MKHVAILIFGSAMCMISWHGIAEARVKAKAQPVDPEKARIAIAILIDAAHEKIPPGNSCHGRYGNQGDPTINGLIAMELSYLHRGRNIITGACSSGAITKCQVRILHSFSEDVSSAEIHFDAENAKLKIETLQCIITP